MHVSKAAAGFALAASVVAVTLLTVVSLGLAGSVRTSAKVQISPHVLNAGEQGFITITFTNTGPSAVNHVTGVVSALFKDGTTTTQGALPIPAGAFSGLPTGCTATSVTATSSTVTCTIGQVKPGSVTRVLEFTAPTTLTPFNGFVSFTFDERKGTALTDTVSDEDPYPFSIATGTTTKGVCTEGGGTLTAGNSAQQTSLVYGALPPASLFPCTPASTGVVPLGLGTTPTNVSNPFNAISFVDFLDDAGLGEVQVIFSTTPPRITKNNLELFEVAKFPFDLTATAGGAPVSDCVQIDGEQQIPPDSDFISCVVDVDNFPGGGLIATLLARGGGDPGWGGVG